MWGTGRCGGMGKQGGGGGRGARGKGWEDEAEDT